MFLVFLNQKMTIQLIYKIQEGKFTFTSYAVFLFNLHLPEKSSFEFILHRSSSRIHNAPESPHWVAMLSSGHSFSIYSALTPSSSFICISLLPGYFWMHRLNEIILTNRQSNSLKWSLSANWRKPGSSAFNQKSDKFIATLVFLAWNSPYNEKFGNSENFLKTFATHIICLSVQYSITVLILNAMLFFRTNFPHKGKKKSKMISQSTLFLINLSFHLRSLIIKLIKH